MKNLIKISLFAVAMISFASCEENKVEETTVETPAATPVVVEPAPAPAPVVVETPAPAVDTTKK